MSSVNIFLTPGYQFKPGEIVTEDKLNALGNPTISADASLGGADISDQTITVNMLQGASGSNGVRGTGLAGNFDIATGNVIVDVTNLTGTYMGTPGGGTPDGLAGNFVATGELRPGLIDVDKLKGTTGSGYVNGMDVAGNFDGTGTLINKFVTLPAQALPTPGSNSIVNHGFVNGTTPLAPLNVSAYLVFNGSSEAGYSNGDIVNINALVRIISAMNSASIATNYYVGPAIAWSWTATQISFCASDTLHILNKNGSGQTQITAANWSIVFICQMP